jgi:hypothetical protein
MDYNILLINPQTQQHSFEKVKGYPVKSDLIPEVKLFAHHPYTKDKSLDFSHYWNISEYESGTALVNHCRSTKQQALEAMESRLQNLNTDILAWVDSQKAKSIEKYGVANNEN